MSAQTYIHPPRWQTDTLIIVQRSDFHYQFPESHRPHLQTLQIFNNKIILHEAIHYRILNYETVEFFSNLSPGDSLRIRYQRLPFDLKRSYVIFKKELLTKDSGQDSLLANKKAVRLREIKFENPFDNLGGGLQTNGSIMRGVQIGTNRDLTLNSGLNVELSGKLTEDVEVVAALTDEATPIQPEGNTQTLQEVDKVFVKFKTPYVEGTVGDFNLNYEQSQFANLSRKLQGITVLGSYENQTLGATVASTRGYFHRISFIGQEGNQGPYQITGKNGERDIIVLAGTERVWVNGQKLMRGESNDYVIEYGNGQIRFTTRQLITSESRLEIDFEYFPAIQKYNRNVYSGIVGGNWAQGKVKLDFKAYRETDDPKQILEEGEALDQAEKEILRAAGDSVFAAYISGAQFRGTNLGEYVKIDSMINGEPYTCFRYLGRASGDYTVSFSYVGELRGDYVRDRLGVYRWVGSGKGNYRPVRLLPLPSRHDLADLNMVWNPSKNSEIKVEYALARFDRNLLSPLNDADNQGSALQLSAGIQEAPLSFKSIDLGKVSLNTMGRYVENTFQPVDRLNQPDFRRFWNVQQAADKTQNEERSFQIDGQYQPVSLINFYGNTGQMYKIDFQSQRYSGRLEVGQNKIAGGSAKYELVKSNDERIKNKSDWKRYSASVERPTWKLNPQILYEGEWRKNFGAEYRTGFRFDDLGGKISFINWRWFEGFVQYGRRFDLVYDYAVSGRLIPQASTTTKRIQLGLLNLAETSASLQFVQRQKNYTDRFENIRVDAEKLRYVDVTMQDTVWQDRTTNLAELLVNHSRWKKAAQISWQYRVSTEQTALREKVYLDVGEGRGNWRFDDYLKEYVPDTDGKYLLFILPSGKFEPVTNLQSALRLQFDPSNYWRKPQNMLQKALMQVSGESYLRIDEETKEEDVRSIYLLNLSKFQKNQTIRGTIQFNQDVFLMRHNREISLRLRYRYQDSRSNQFLDLNENEDRLQEELGVRADWRLSSKLRSQSELRRRLNTRDSKANQLRNRNITGYYGNQNFSYRPWAKWEFGFESEYANEQNRTTLYPISLWYGVAKGRADYSLAGRGRASAEYRYQTVEITENELNRAVPFEMAGGKRQGASQNWQLRIEYTVAKNILFTVFYNGRKDAGFEKTIHTGQAEVRAYF